MTTSTTVDEVFEIFDENNHSIGKELRKVVHSKGLLHRAVNVFIFNPNGQLLIQRRNFNKDVCPGLWDLSVAEHLKIGESYSAAASRGLKEELSIDIGTERLKQIRGQNLKKFDDQKTSTMDYEWQECWMLDGFAGKVKIDEVEVIDWKYVQMEELKEMLKMKPEQFTPWFKEDLEYYIKKS